MIWIGIGATTLVQVIFTYTPLFHELFQTAPLPVDTWLRVTIVGAASFAIVEVVKYFEIQMEKDPTARRNHHEQTPRN